MREGEIDKVLVETKKKKVRQNPSEKKTNTVGSNFLSNRFSQKGWGGQKRQAIKKENDRSKERKTKHRF